MEIRRPPVKNAECRNPGSVDESADHRSRIAEVAAKDRKVKLLFLTCMGAFLMMLVLAGLWVSSP